MIRADLMAAITTGKGQTATVNLRSRLSADGVQSNVVAQRGGVRAMDCSIWWDAKL